VLLGFRPNQFPKLGGGGDGVIREGLI